MFVDEKKFHEEAATKVRRAHFFPWKGNFIGWRREWDSNPR